MSSRSAAAARLASAVKGSATSSGSRANTAELWIITTYCEGGSLQQAARRGEFLTADKAFAVEPAVKVLADVARGMVYCEWYLGAVCVAPLDVSDRGHHHLHGRLHQEQHSCFPSPVITCCAPECAHKLCVLHA